MADRWFELAAQALHAAMSNPHDPTEAAGHVKALHEECGADGIVSAILAWSDTLIDQAGFPTDGTAIQAAWMPQDTGVIQDAEATEPVARWAGRLIIARATGDEATWAALMDSVPQEPAVQADHIMCLLALVALNVRMLEQGTHPALTRG